MALVPVLEGTLASSRVCHRAACTVVCLWSGRRHNTDHQQDERPECVVVGSEEAVAYRSAVAAP